MSTVMMLLTNVLFAILIFTLGFSKGKNAGRKEVNEHNVKLGKFYQAKAEKQAAQIEKLQDRMQYLTIGELESFVNFMKDDDDGYGVDENYPVLAIVGSLDDAQINLDENHRKHHE